MKISSFGARALVISAAAALLAGCGGSRPPIGSAVSPAARAPGGNQALMYVANWGADDVTVYYETSKQLDYDITKGISKPYGLYVDQNGTLYVANQGNNTVSAYPAGSASPSTTWSQNLDGPLFPIVDGSGDLFVSNSNNGNVVEYQAGSTKAYQVLQTPGSQTDGMDFDAQGDLYVAYRGPYGSPGCEYACGSVEEFESGSTQGKILGMALRVPEGIIVDNVGNILVAGWGCCIDMFPPGEQTPSQQVSTKCHGLSQLAMQANGAELFVAGATEGHKRSQGWICHSVYPFPNDNKLPVLLTDKEGGEFTGIALSNGQTF